MAPVRRLDSPVLKWPGQDTVDAAVREWASNLAAQHPQLLRAGYFGSYARGDWGVGSDVDLVLIVARADEPFERRAVAFSASDLPVPADVLIYTEAEWRRICEREGGKAIARETVWVYDRS